ncbi:MAG: ribosome-associated translation inhibitor RaiA [Bacteroidota bacterium]
MKVSTQALHFNADSTLIHFVEQKLEKLDKFFGDIIDASVVLKLDNNSGKRKDKVTEVKMILPGCVLYVKETSKTFESSVDGAVFALSSQLSKYKYKRMRSRRA